MATLMFTPNYALRVRAQPLYPVGTKLCLSNSCTLIRGSIQRGSTLKSEAHKGGKPQRNSNPNFNSNMKSGKDEAEATKIEMYSLLQTLCSSIEDHRGVTKARRSTFEPKERASELTPRKKVFGDIESSGYLSNFEKLTKHEGDKDGAFSRISISNDGIRTSGPLLNAKKMTRDDGNNNGSFSSNSISTDGIRSSEPFPNLDKLLRHDGGIDNASQQNFKLSRPPSKFVRRSPIPISKSTEEAPKTIPIEEEPPYIVVREEAPNTFAIEEQPQLIVVREETSKEFEGKSAKLGELQGSEFEGLKLAELREIAKARGLRGCSRLRKAELVDVLLGLPVLL